MHFLITGHTGFKGSWLAQMLDHSGHKVSGIALDPKVGDLFEIAQLTHIFKFDIRQDIRNFQSLERAIATINPDVLIHLAAQPLVLQSYKDPVETYETNVLGTLNVLRASENVETLRARLIVTTDKVYKNNNKIEGYQENDPLGGVDPYSASKAMADILAQSWSTQTKGSPIGIARAGNVIGGGDFSADRILTDIVTAFNSGKILELRNPNSVRPWQHVLDCLDGYLSIVENLLNKSEQDAWNIGPQPNSYKTVNELVASAEKSWGKKLKTRIRESDLIETPHLTLNPDKAKRELGWENNWEFSKTILKTIDWYKRFASGEKPADLCKADIDAYYGYSCRLKNLNRGELK